MVFSGGIPQTPHAASHRQDELGAGKSSEIILNAYIYPLLISFSLRSLSHINKTSADMQSL